MQQSKYKSKYKILNLVGRGQFGRVFAAIELSSGALVALKELNTRQLSTSSFLRELTFLVTLDHFNIATCKALEHSQNKRYLVMDYCEAGTLRGLIDGLIDGSTTIDLPQSLKLTIDILRGLEYAHQQGIIHRDIKPENILLKSSDRGYTAHIADFGIAKLGREPEEAKGVLGNTGSPAYMAPEQFYGEYSFNSDLYGVGVILYELVTGERPFSGMPKELLAAHLSRPVPYNTDIPILIRRAIAKALEKLPQRRFQTATEMLASLELILEIWESDPNPMTSARIPPQFSPLLPIAELPINEATSYLAIANNEVYLCGGERLIIKRYRDLSLSGEAIATAEFKLTGEIDSLQSCSTGLLITTTASLYFLTLQHDLTGEPVAIVSNLQPASIATADPQGLWVVSSSPANADGSELESQLAVYRLPEGRLQRSLSRKKSWQHLIALDRRRGMAICPTSAQNTEFHLFNRRGNWLANFTAQIQLDRVVYNPLFGDRFIATEKNNPRQIILITLEIFSLRRVAIEIEPTIIESCPQGYLLSDCQGRIIILDSYGEPIGRYQISLPAASTVTAIVISDPRLLVASSSGLQSRLQVFSWSQIALEEN